MDVKWHTINNLYKYYEVQLSIRIGFFNEVMFVSNFEKIQIVNFNRLDEGKNFLDLIKLAYTHLKFYLYYDKFPLIYRQYLSDFESISKIDLELEKIATNLEFLIKPEGKNFIEMSSKILENITYIPFPKKILSPLEIKEDTSSIQLITNDRKFSEYYLDKFELFIDTKCKDPTSSAISFVTIQIIGILWIYYIGVVLDDSLDPSCYGSRIKQDFKSKPQFSKYIYNRYFDKYTEWRDKGLNVAQNLLDVEKRDALIISLDVTRFYYSITLDFKEIKKDYENEIKTNYSYLSHSQNNNHIVQNIHKVLQEIHERFTHNIKELLPIIHKPDNNQITNILPIGLITSGIIGNWYLKKTDREIIRQYNPDYYGRYVDDILIVIKSSNQIKELINNCSDDNKRIFQILKHQFSLQKEDPDCIKLNESQIFKYKNDDKKNIIYLNSFRILDSLNNKPINSFLTIQIEKTRIYHLDKDSSRAVLSKLKKTIQKNASFFRFLPDNDWDVSLDEVAYDIISKGSMHKIRNIVDVSENDYELVKYLSSISIKYKLCCLNDDEINKVVEQLFHFFNGVNIIKHFKLWERIFSILFLFNKKDEIFDFYEMCKNEIYKINLKSLILGSFLKDELNKLLEDSLDGDREKVNSIIKNSIEYQINYPKNENESTHINELLFKNKFEFISKTSSLIKTQCSVESSIFSEKDPRLDEFLSKYYEFNQKHLGLLESVTNSLLISLFLSLSLPVGLINLNQICNEEESNEKSSKKLKNIEKFYCNPELLKNAEKFRKSNLIRDQYIVYPLINLISSEKSSLIDYKKLYSSKFDNTSQEPISIDQAIFKYPSKIYHLWEYLLLLHYIKFSHNKSQYLSLFSEFFDKNSQSSTNGTQESELQIISKAKEKWIEVPPNKPPIDKNLIIEEYYFPHEKEKYKLKIGIAHLNTDESDVLKNLMGDPNISIERQNNLYSILNNAEKLECDLIIFPELSIPIYWLPFMVAHSKRHQIGIIFGLEHWSVQTEEEQNYAYNFAVSVLPFKEHDVYNDCLVTIRKKNHYAPLEEKQINEARIDIPPAKKNIYHIFHWRGASFTVFNCYELADINHKAQFRSKIDFLVAIEYNKDTPYFSNIVESISRDLHCYVIQVNIPKFGDSRIIQPKKSELRDLACISGGENCTLLVATINIKSLRDFQLQDKFCGDGEFKPLPPGFNPKDVKQRGKLEKSINKNDHPIFVKKSGHN